MREVMPAHVSEMIIAEFCRDVPGAVRWVEQRVVPGEEKPRALLSGDGLLALGEWIARTCPLSLEVQLDVLGPLHDLSLAAGMPGVAP
jgi:hypothetical protein